MTRAKPELLRDPTVVLFAIRDLLAQTTLTKSMTVSG